MGGEFEKLEKAESELKARIDAKEAEYRGLDERCIKLQSDIEQLERIPQQFTSSLEELNLWIIRRDFQLYTMEGQYAPVTVDAVMKQRQKLRTEYEKVDALMQEMETKIVENKLDQKRDELEKLRSSREKAEKECRELRSKWQHYFGQRGNYDWD